MSGLHRTAAALLAVLVAPTRATEARAQEIVGRSETSFSVAERVATGGWVRIGSPNGAIKVVAGRGSEVQIRAEKRVSRGSVEDVGFVVRRTAGGITVCAVFRNEDECSAAGDYQGDDLPRRWSDDHRVSIDFTVSVPQGARIKVGTGNGAFAIEGVGADVIASTGNGRLDISGSSARVTASTGNGQVMIDGARGPVEVSTGNGPVHVASATGEITANTGNGAIDVAIDRLDPPADLDLTTGSGRITVTAPAGFGAELRWRTGNGLVRTDFPLETTDRLSRSRGRGTIGNGNGRLEARSGNGDVVIRRSP